MDFPYKEVKKGIFRPVIPVYLHSNKESFGYEAMLDSGADYNIFHGDIGRALNLEIEKGEETAFGGITSEEGSESVGYIHKVELEVIKGERFDSFAIFSDKIADLEGYGVLGQLGFFNNYTVKFMYKDKKVRVSRII